MVPRPPVEHVAVMRWEYIGTGLAILAIGVSIVLAVPPPWWPKMPSALIQAAIVLGLVLIAFGFWVCGTGAWPGLPEPRGPIALTTCSAVFLVLGAGWWWFTPQLKAETRSAEPVRPPPPHLIRTLSYQDFGIQVVNNRDQATIGHLAGKIVNVGQDALMVDIKNFKITVGTSVIMDKPLYIEHYMATGQGIDLSIATLRPAPVLSTEDSEITEEFSVEYDTASPSGLRRSYRKITVPLTWNNGQCFAGRGRIIDARED